MSTAFPDWAQTTCDAANAAAAADYAPKVADYKQYMATGYEQSALRYYSLGLPIPPPNPPPSRAQWSVVNGQPTSVDWTDPNLHLPVFVPPPPAPPSSPIAAPGAPLSGTDASVAEILRILKKVFPGV